MALPQSSGSAALPIPLWDKADIYMPVAIVTPTNRDMLAEVACVKSVILVFNVCRRPLAYFCILNQNVPKYVPNCLYIINFMFINNNLQNCYGAPTRHHTPLITLHKDQIKPFRYN